MRYLKKIVLLSVLGLLSGCGGVQGLIALQTDPLLPKVKELNALAGYDSVGLEWKQMGEDGRITGFNVYRGTPSEGEQNLKRIGTAVSRYATHFVDRYAKPNTQYLYAVTTLGVASESLPGKIVRVKTKQTLRPVLFAKAYKVDEGVVKILWTPHPCECIDGYIIQRRINGSEWHYLNEVKGRLMPEYIDTSVRQGNFYEYRILAKSFRGTKSLPSKISGIRL